MVCYLSASTILSYSLLIIQHGIKRIRQSNEERELRKRRERSKIEEFNNLTEAVLMRVRIPLCVALFIQTDPVYRRRIETGPKMHSWQRHDFCKSIQNSTPSGITDETSLFMESSQTSKASYSQRLATI